MSNRISMQKDYFGALVETMTIYSYTLDAYEGVLQTIEQQDLSREQTLALIKSVFDYGQQNFNRLPEVSEEMKEDVQEV